MANSLRFDDGSSDYLNGSGGAGATKTNGLTTAGNACLGTAASYAATSVAPETMKLTLGAADSLTYDGKLLANG